MAQPIDIFVPLPQVMPPERPRTCCQKTLRVVQIALAILAGAALFLYSPTIFIISFVVGVIFARSADKAIFKIMEVWKSRPCVAVVTALAVSAFVVLSLPSALLVGAGLSGLYLGSQLYQWSKNEWYDHNRVDLIVRIHPAVAGQ